jgi:hypothetical protein
MLEEATGPGRRFRTAALEAPFGRGVNFQIEVSDVRGLYASLLAAGLEPVLEIEERRYRVEEGEVLTTQFVIADEDGYLLRFFSDSPRSSSSRPQATPVGWRRVVDTMSEAWQSVSARMNRMRFVVVADRASEADLGRQARPHWRIFRPRTRTL